MVDWGQANTKLVWQDRDIPYVAYLVMVVFDAITLAFYTMQGQFLASLSAGNFQIRIGSYVDLNVLVDEKDIAILNLLRENPRATYQELSTRLAAQGVEISTVGVLKRVERLKEKGVIKHFTVKTNSEKLGLTTPILILVRLRPKPIKEFVKDIQCRELQDPRILSLHTLAHQYNLAIPSPCKRNLQLRL